MYYDKEFFDWYKHEHLPQPPIAWTQLQAARKKYADSKEAIAERLVQKTEAKLALTQKKLKAATKALADCQAKLIQRDRQLCVCRIKVLKVPAK